jgi:hypothetical protein
VGLRLTLWNLLASWSGPEGWRARRARWFAPSKPSYDAYPDRDMPPTIRFYIEARDARGRLLREYVDLEGYSIHQLNWRQGAQRGGVQVRDWFVSQMLEAMVRLMARIDLVREEKETA